MNKLAAELVLSCNSWQQAQSVIDHLFAKKLITKAEILPLQKGAEEVKLIVEHIEEDMERIEQEITALFGHGNYHLQAIPR